MMSPSQAISILLALSCCSSLTTALSTIPAKQHTSPSNAINRRNAFSSIFAIGVGATAFLPVIANAGEDNQVLNDDEMAARVARKMELLKKKSGGGGPAAARSDNMAPGATDIRSDVNPDAGVNLRSRSALENAKIAMDKQKEMKGRDVAKKREDMCEMLGRGC
mmetsp:Transcript_5310/g.12056  ORF Transcript_5310/g.12056 Transcript_5310/m.12056 type:complete len:164 (+) Transcript_5310:171-662(+)|eukprot:CAMPEP_0172310318 /NCGR_PEP_ID=MMETSP1058-20130122/11419_1 /TAXON_ID=83371 /ORGANISM="Detonula confervacea, Strain CCMP 353" /LENGTH=163 /DNA_ID=CAMNT_0013023113 /DNA_START=108 /DNA_END=599 /DNA_ORIENTATION=-